MINLERKIELQVPSMSLLKSKMILGVRSPNPTEVEHNKEFRQIMREQRNEELAQQGKREARAKNILIHGFPESSGANEEKEADSNRIRQLTDVLTRLGKRDENKSRPIKLRM